MLKGCKITKKIKSFPTDFLKNQPEATESKMAKKGLNCIRSKNQHHFHACLKRFLSELKKDKVLIPAFRVNE